VLLAWEGGVGVCNCCIVSLWVHCRGGAQPRELIEGQGAALLCGSTMPLSVAIQGGLRWVIQERQRCKHTHPMLICGPAVAHVHIASLPGA